MDTSSSVESVFDDDSDEIPIPSRSPSRLDFCMEDIEDDAFMGTDPPTHALEFVGWDALRDGRPCAFVEEEALEVDMAPVDPPRLPLVESMDGEEDMPQATDSHNEIADTSPMPQELPMDQVVPEPVAPTPVRPPPVQLQVDVQEHMPRSRISPQRLNYPHHGFSRSALQQRKSLWNSRHEEWAKWQSRLQQGEAQQSQEYEANNAYTGLQPRVTDSPPPVRTPPSGMERDLVDHPPKKHEEDASVFIFPRVGDISALRDPYAADVDRSFFRYPLWTIQKALYVFDMHWRSTSCAPSTSMSDAARIQASSSSSTLSSYASTLGDDQESDSTLVADDSPIPQSKPHQGPLTYASSPKSLPSRNRFRGWYARWELLIDLFQHNQARHDSLEISTMSQDRSTFETPPPPPLEPMFRFRVGEDGGDDDDEEEDYGTIISNSSFSVNFEEEYARAMEFMRGRGMREEGTEFDE